MYLFTGPFPNEHEMIIVNDLTHGVYLNQWYNNKGNTNQFS